MKCFAVIGAGFGDEGKGLVVDWLCSKSKNPLVIRFCGGHQAGHQVVTENGHHHVFSNFGSGTFRGAPTYWSEYCTVDPIGIMNELKLLKYNSPLLYINAKCPVTTPFDIRANLNSSKINGHGSCGVGVRTTYKREEDHYSLLFEDLYNPAIFRIKLRSICDYYNDKMQNLSQFMTDVADLRRSQCVRISDSVPLYNIKTIIFEGSQGLLLDQNFGFFPHVTPSNTGTKNILEMGFTPEIFLVTRAYQTRHGNGPMTNEELPHSIMENPHEKNSSSSYQGEFRRTLLDINLLEHGINKDKFIKNDKKKNLVITCLDLVQSDHRLTVDGEIINCFDEKDFISKIDTFLNVKNIYLSRSPIATGIIKHSPNKIRE